MRSRPAPHRPEPALFPHPASSPTLGVAMTDIALPTSAPASLRTMAGIEARRLARHPAFLVGVVLAFGVLVLLYVLDEDPHLGDLLSMPVIPAFFIGLPSLVATSRLTRST